MISSTGEQAELSITWTQATMWRMGITQEQ